MESTGTSLKEGRREYLWQLNVIRFISAVMVLLFHIHANLPVDFHALRPLVSNVAPWMTTFFILSGFILDYNYNGRDFFEGDNLFSFWKKRFFSIYPMYVMVWVFFYVIFTQSITATDFYTLPSQILMIQSFENYDYLANAGSWFFSCIFFCYLAFPLIVTAASKLNNKARVIILTFIAVFELTLPFLSSRFIINVYSNAFCRMAEFIFGAVLSSLLRESSAYARFRSGKNHVVKDVARILLWGGFLGGIYLFTSDKDLNGRYPLLMNLFATVMTMLIITLSLSSESSLFRKTAEFRPVSYIARCSLEFWAASFFSLQVMHKIVRWIMPDFHKNVLMIFYTIVLNVLITVLLHKVKDYYYKRSREISFYKAILTVAVIMIALFLVRGWGFAGYYLM